MNDYIKLLILSYFKQGNGKYSFLELAKQFGITLSTLDCYLDELIDSNELQYDNYLLTLSPKGSLTLVNSCADYFDFSDQYTDSIVIDKKSAWAADKLYIPKNFLSKL